MDDKTSRGADPVQTLERLENEIYQEYQVNHKPAGIMWVNMVIDLAKRITSEPGLLNAISEKHLEQLTQDNFHTARHAAETVLHLKKYTI